MPNIMGQVTKVPDGKKAEMNDNKNKTPALRGWFCFKFCVYNEICKLLSKLSAKG